MSLRYQFILRPDAFTFIPILIKQNTLKKINLILSSYNHVLALAEILVFLIITIIEITKTSIVCIQLNKQVYKKRNRENKQKNDTNVRGKKLKQTIKNTVKINERKTMTKMC
eukprot:GHVL01037229.1.p1 GENE.GHVL01037229.1~~GHVL01037229.1.p1  ORF type:complete len:112 (-),score=12.80 GHVL01037229.1:25-360(-)